MLYKNPGGRYFIAKFNWRGKVYRKSTRMTNRKDAITAEAKFRTAIAKGEWDLLEAKPVPQLRTFLEKEFLPFVRTKSNTKPKTVEYYETGAERLKAIAFAELPLNQITDQQAAQFAAANAHLSPSTINNGLRTLRRALSLAVQWGKLNRMPKITLAKGERQRDRVLTPEESELYLNACAQPWKDVATVILGTGMRPGEVYGLRCENVLLDSEGGYIQITEGKTKAAKRLLPMLPGVYNALVSRHEAQQKPSRGWVFPTTAACGHLDENTAKGQHARALKRINDAAKAEAKKQEKPVPAELQFEPYCLRHTALTRLAESGCDSFTLAKIAGHSSVTITQRYCHPQAEAIERAFAKIATGRKVVTDGGHREKSPSETASDRQPQPAE